MIIKSIELIGLHGYLNKKIEFYKDTSLLVGINGAGKTSILNLISWIIQPSIPHLCVTNFKSIKLKLSYNDINYKITCEHLENIFTYKVTNNINEDFKPLVVRTKYSLSTICNDDDFYKMAFAEYSELRPDEEEIKTWELIKSFPRPTIIGLDRHIYAEESEKIYYEKSGLTKSKKNINSLSPIDRVKSLINNEYRISKNIILKLTNDLKNHLMLSTFSGTINLDSFDLGIKKKLDVTQIDKAQKRVNEYFNEYANIDLNKEQLDVINYYFVNLKNITHKYISEPNDTTIKLLYGLNANQYLKIKKLLEEFENFEKETKEAKKKIDHFINVVNYFFKDSSKKLIFKEDISNISFKSIDRNLNEIGEFRDIKNLSSGEQQLLILFSYIAFNSGDGKIFIIDEPELSLHIKWQEDFLDYLEEIKPKGIQVILATHSPILANKKRDKSILILPYNE